MASISNISSAGASDSGKSGTFYCNLFSDNVTEHLCELRRNELIAMGAFSCEGCPVMTMQGADHERPAVNAG